MAARQGLKESSESSDDEAVSLTSTQCSVHSKDHRYTLEGIRFEDEDEEGDPLYLVKWEGYDELRDTWEPETDLKGEILSEEILSEWADQKMRISRGLAKPFDVLAWMERVDAQKAASIKRRERRRQKKIDLGLIVEDGEASLEDASRIDYSEESNGLQSPNRQSRPSSPVWTAKEESTLLEGLRQFKSTDWQWYLKMYGSSGTISRDLRDRTEKGLLRKAIALEKAFKESGKEFPVRIQHDQTSNVPLAAKDGTAAPPSQRSQSSKAGARGVASIKRKADAKTLRPSKPEALCGSPRTIKRPEEPATRVPKRTSGIVESTSAPAGSKSSQRTSSTAKPTPSSPRRPSLPQTSNEGRPTHLGPVGRGPARAAPPVAKTQEKQGINVMKNWAAEPAKRRKSRYEKISAQEGQETSWKTFQKFSTRRKHELATRYEHAPDVGCLTFVDLKDPKKLSKAPVTAASKMAPKTPSQPILEQTKEKPDDPPVAPHVASKPALQRAATTGTSISASRPPPLVTRDPGITEDMEMADPAMEALPISLGPRRASLPTEAATQRLVPQQQTFAAPVAVMGSGPDTTKYMTAAVEHHIPTPSEATLPQRRDSAAKKPEPSSKQEPGSHSDSRRAVESAVVQSPGLVHLTPQQRPRAPDETERKPSSHEGTEQAAVRPAPVPLPVPGNGSSLFPLISRPNRPRADFGTLRVDGTDVIGEILTGPQGDKTSTVIFRGLDWELKKLFITIKVPPRQMHVWFKTMCTAGEFLTIFHVSEASVAGFDAQSDSIPARKKLSGIRLGCTVSADR